MLNNDPSLQLLQIFRGIVSIFIMVWIWKKASAFFKSDKLKNMFWRVRNYLRTLYRISSDHRKFNRIVWKDLNQLHKNANWKYGIFESEKYVETVFEIGPDEFQKYFYMIYDGQFHCRVKVLDNFSPDFASELFILASHFNNLLNNGVVIVNVKSGYVEYHVKTELILHIVYPGELHAQIKRHYNTSKDMFWAFNKLVNENEEPALIIADLLKMNEQKGSNQN